MRTLVGLALVSVVCEMAAAGTVGDSLAGFPTANGTDCKWTTATEATLTVPDGKEYALDTAGSDLLGAAKIVKAGDGTLYATNKALWTYTGQITVSDGVWVMQHGLKNNDWYSDVGNGFRNSKPLTVQDGATLFVRTKKGGADEHIQNHYFHGAALKFTGTGHNGMGALRVNAKQPNGVNYTFGSFFNNFSIVGDALFVFETSVSCDSTVTAINGDGGTLTIRFPNPNTSLTYTFGKTSNVGLVIDAVSANSTFIPNGSDSNGATTYLGADSAKQRSLSFVQKTPPFVSRLSCSYLNTGDSFTLPIDVPAGGLDLFGRVTANDTPTSRGVDIWSWNAVNRFRGELRLNGPFRTYYNYGSTKSYSRIEQQGKVTGSGPISVGLPANANHSGWMRLTNQANDFTGDVTVGAQTYATNAKDPQGRSFTGLETLGTAIPANVNVNVKNADLVSGSTGATVGELGKVAISGDACVTGTLMHATSLVLNQDAGTVTLAGYLKTPAVTLNGGTLKAKYVPSVLSTESGLNVAYYDISGETTKSALTLDNTPPDVIFDRGETKHGHSTLFTTVNGPGLSFYRGDDGTGKQVGHAGLTMTFNDGTTVSSLDKLATMDKTDWIGATATDGQYRAYAFEGYLWNRSATNETWYFMGTWNHAAYMWVDDMETKKYLFQFPGYAAWSTFSNRSEVAKKVLTPGAHKFRLVYYNTSRGMSWGSKNGTGDATRSWWDALGLSYCRGWNPVATKPHSAKYPDYGVYTDYYMDYTPMLDFAGGKLYTRSTVDAKDLTIDVATLTMAAGTTLDLTALEGESVVSNFVGNCTVLGGNVRHIRTVSIGAADLAARTGDVCGLSSTGRLAFAEDAKVIFRSDGTHLPPSGVKVISSASAIEGPAQIGLEVVGANGNFRLEKSADGRSYTLSRVRTGAALYVR